ncbi:lipase family protein [Hymenobacter gummosus]|uniref:Lipase family protein n=1 Tax=Hymenobacter gummosus TaxID=1776032 RepID=A0A431U845_9BACT|nr:lipase family protein [Hymenobacter gummosus]RTQ52431.1 lipase family protein [Hymenobacter gummosus]
MADSTSSAPFTAAPALTLDQSLTLVLAQASLAAYAEYAGKPYTMPDNCTLVGGFTGWDGWLGPFDKEEKFGLVFQYAGSATAQPGYIVAFRGTDSTLDIIEDSFWDLCPFQPYQNSLPTPASVSTGFFDIYLTKGGSMTASMQDQVFSLLPAGATPVYATGHSLGAALSQLFALDLSVSQPGRALTCLNFASPRVGDATWQAACDDSGATQAITRVVNYHDLVPDYPMEILSYVSIGAQFEVAFRRIHWWEYNPISNHSMANLQTVLTHCLPLTPQSWTGTFPDYVNAAYTMSSTPPPATPKAEWLNKLQEMHETASSTADALA